MQNPRKLTRKKTSSGPASGSNFDDPQVDEPGPVRHIGAEAAERRYWKNTTDTAERPVYVCASFRRHIRKKGKPKGVAETLQRLVLGEKE
jgi:hypothetical protein